MEDILFKINERMKSFSKGHKIIGKYILDNFDKAAFMTASSLASEIGVSESTVVRFASLLGFEGYRDFRESLRDLTIKKSTPYQRMEITSRKMGEENILSSVLKADISNIMSTLEEIDEEQFECAVDAVMNAENIYIMGVRSTSTLASFAGRYFNLIFENSHVIRSNAGADIFEQLMRIKSGDVVIGISFPRYSKNTRMALEYAKKQGATVISITDNINSPVVKYSDYCLTAKSGMESFADSLVAPMSVINAFIAALGMKKKNEVKDVFEKLENIWDEYEVYNK